VAEQDKKFKLFTLKNLKLAAVFIAVFGFGMFVSEANLINLDKYIQIKGVNQQPSEQLDYRAVEEVYRKLQSSFDGELDQKKLEDGLREGLVRAAGDPFTEFLDEEASKEFEENLNGSFEGIGAELSKDEEFIIIVSPIEGFPAKKAGLRSKDAIVEINGESTIDISVTEAVKKIRGPKGTKVKLGIIRDGQRLDFEITRATISIPSVKTEKIGKDIGVVRISRFGEDTEGLARQAAAEFKAANVSRVILDLRGNPGGLLGSSVDVASAWLEEGKTILQEKRGGEVIETYFASGNSVFNGVKTVVLIDGGSASASEIVAGALKDNKAAVLIGEESFGKGSVQDVNRLDFGGILKVTVARWFTPSGVNIDKDGIKPDKQVKITEQDIKVGKDPQEAAAIAYLRKL